MARQGLGLQLFKPLQVASNDFVDELAKRVFSTYRRVTLRDGGDHEAEFVLTGRQKVLENNFSNWIGYHFVEKLGALTTFQGYIHEMQFRTGGKMLRITLDGMANHIRRRYKTSQAGSYTLSSATTDQDSIDYFGQKESILDTRIPMGALRASENATDHKNLTAWPNAYGTDILSSDDTAPALYIMVKGYIHTLDWNYYNAADETASSAFNTLISTVIGSHDFVSAGKLTNASTTSTEVTSDYVTKLRYLGEHLKNTGQAWGCFGGRDFDVLDVDITAPTYRRRMRSGRRIVTHPNGTAVVPQLVKPYGLLWTEDVFAGPKRNSTLAFDPRADVIAGVEFSARGVEFISANRPGSYAQSQATQYAENYINEAKLKGVPSAENLGIKPKPMPTTNDVAITRR